MRFYIGLPVSICERTETQGGTNRTLTMVRFQDPVKLAEHEKQEQPHPSLRKHCTDGLGQVFLQKRVLADDIIMG